MYDYLSLLFWEKKIHYKTPRGIIKVNTQSTAHMDVDKEKEDKNCKIQPSSQAPPWLKLQKNKKEKRKPWHPYKKWSKKQFFNFKISSLSLLNILLFLSYGYWFFYFFYWVFFTTFHIPECWLLKTSQVFPSVWFYWTGGRFCCYLRRCDGIKAEPVCQGTINLIGFIGKSASDGDWSHWTL